jgi:K+-transporting ATPase A subunit
MYAVSRSECVTGITPLCLFSCTCIVLLNQIFGGITSPVYIYFFLVRLGVLQAILLIMATPSYGF